VALQPYLRAKTAEVVSHAEVKMGRKVEGSAPCPHCGCTSVRKNGSTRGKPRWHCPDCGKSFGATHGTPMYRLRTPVHEIVLALLIVMRHGSLRAAEEITGHKYETTSKWLQRAGDHAEEVTQVLVRDLELDEVEVDAFWSFVGNGAQALRTSQVRHKAWGRRWIQERAGAASA
jgi:transposase-like protein